MANTPKSTLFLLSIVLLLNRVTAAPNGSEQKRIVTDAWYWRDFAGVVPKDALPGGKDDDGNPIYIGQVLHNDCLIPAKIYENDRQAHYPYNGVENSASKNVKILCTDKPDMFEWISTTPADLKSITDAYLVPGGFQPGHKTYIGRILHEAELTVGKVMLKGDQPASIWTANDDEEINHKNDPYEVLAYMVQTYDIDKRILHL